MDELVAQIAANTGVDPAVARQAIGIILKFLLNEGPEIKVQALIDALPGASDASEAVANAPEIGGSGIMDAFNALSSAGLGMSDIQGVTQEFLAFAKSRVGDNMVDEIVGSIPGLNQIV
jgi:hypothetical protein